MAANSEILLSVHAQLQYIPVTGVWISQNPAAILALIMDGFATARLHIKRFAITISNGENKN